MIEPAAARADTMLAAIDGAFDYLLLVSPVDEREAWARFRADGFGVEPSFTYAPVELDVAGRRRELSFVPVDEVSDPILAGLLEAKRRELDHELAMIAARGTPEFLEHSIAISGAVDDHLVEQARAVLAVVGEVRPDAGPTVDASAFAARAEDEVASYRRQDPALPGVVELRDDVVSLMVSRHRVIVPVDRRVGTGRVEALVHHEVGTHLLTWWNGTAQPLGLLANGLARYEETQEGLGVLAEHLGGELTPAALAEHALRAVAAASAAGREPFTSTFARLADEHGAAPHQAFRIATRVHRGGGLVKDAGYLRGLLRLVEHLRAGGSIDPLLLGKFALDDLGAVDDLARRGTLVPPRLHPNWLDERGAGRLAALRDHPGDTLAALLPPPCVGR